MWVDKMLDPLPDLELWPWPWIFKVKFWKKLYPWSGLTDWHGMKGMWVDRKLNPLCEIDLSRDLDLGFSRSNLRITVSREWEGDWHGTKVMWVVKILNPPLRDLELRSWSWTFKVKLWIGCIPRMRGPADMERKGCESAGCWTHYVTLTFDLTPWPWTWFFKVKFSNSLISGMGGSVYFEGKECGSDMMLDPLICTFDLPYGLARGLQHTPK